MRTAVEMSTDNRDQIAVNSDERKEMSEKC